MSLALEEGEGEGNGGGGTLRVGAPVAWLLLGRRSVSGSLDGGRRRGEGKRTEQEGRHAPTEGRGKRRRRGRVTTGHSVGGDGKKDGRARHRRGQKVSEGGGAKISVVQCERPGAGTSKEVTATGERRRRCLNLGVI